jgi:hypothetical protein
MLRCETDLSLTPKGDSYQLLPRSVFGMVWLQTHFETSTWDLICSGAVRLKAESCDALCRDASTAGLNVAKLPAVLVS